MLSIQHEESQEIFKDNFVDSRLNELMSRYEEPVRAIVHRTLEEYVERAFAEFMEGRAGTIRPRASDGKAVMEYRNGTRNVKQAVIDTLVLKDFRIPRSRAGGFNPEILGRLKRKAGIFADCARELYVNGVSTRKVRRSFERIGLKISGLSKSTVSDVTKDLLKEYLQWINRPIKMKYDYLQVDGVYLTIRKSSVRKPGTLVVIGITKEGQKEVLHFTLGSESERNFDEVLQNLIRRGLDVNAVKLVIADGAKGPINSIISHFGRDKLQRCTVHKTRNILDKCPKNLHEEMKAKLGRLWNQTSRLEAEQYLERFVREYEQVARRSVDCLLEDKEDLLRYYGMPSSHWKTVRNTNLIERVNHEVRRRTKVMATIDSEKGCYGILMGIVREQNERWSKRSHWHKS
jgi:transposase-like protein